MVLHFIHVAKALLVLYKIYTLFMKEKRLVKLGSALTLTTAAYFHCWFANVLIPTVAGI